MTDKLKFGDFDVAITTDEVPADKPPEYCSICGRAIVEETDDIIRYSIYTGQEYIIRKQTRRHCSWANSGMWKFSLGQYHDRWLSNDGGPWEKQV